MLDWIWQQKNIDEKFIDVLQKWFKTVCSGTN